MSKKKSEKFNSEKIWKTTKSIGRTTSSIAHGILGDRLEKWSLPFSQEMCLIQDGKALELNKESISNLHLTGKISVLVHGLVSDETMWTYDVEKDYGRELQKEFGISPVYLRYNSGRHISDNGKSLDAILQVLCKLSPKKIQEITFVTHSMGGLVTRSACFYGQKNRSNWVSRVKRIFFIGSPHHGAPLEKFGNLVTTILGKIPNPFTYLTKEAINLRSAGIKDLRYGFLVEEDWKGKDLDAFHIHEKTHVPLLKTAKHYIISGTVSENEDSFLSTFFGDAVVGKESSLGKSGNAKYNLEFSHENIKIIPGVHHIQLMHDPQVYEALRGLMK